MRQWTPEERQRQAERIREWQPWKTVKPKTEKGKAASRKNALKHGAYSEETRAMRRVISECRARLETPPG